MMHLTVAMTEQRVIGKRNDLPWHIADDLKRFKRLTTGQTIIMGKRTYDSIGRPLPNRNNIVLDAAGEPIDGVDVCKSIPAALSKAEGYKRETFIIGGASVYEQMLPVVDVLHISHVKKNYEGDIYFPDYDKSDWQEVGEAEEYNEFTARTYERVKQHERVAEKN